MESSECLRYRALVKASGALQLVVCGVYWLVLTPRAGNPAVDGVFDRDRIQGVRACIKLTVCEGELVASSNQNFVSGPTQTVPFAYVIAFLRFGKLPLDWFGGAPVAHVLSLKTLW